MIYILYFLVYTFLKTKNKQTNEYLAIFSQWSTLEEKRKKIQACKSHEKPASYLEEENMCFPVKKGGAPPEQKSGNRNLSPTTAFAFLIAKKNMQSVTLHNDRRDRLLCVWPFPFQTSFYYHHHHHLHHDDSQEQFCAVTQWSEAKRGTTRTGQRRMKTSGTTVKEKKKIKWRQLYK